jgi:lipopolysaccharide/colanic/teichoic acid biosynthesis glycosyltransferase
LAEVATEVAETKTSPTLDLLAEDVAVAVSMASPHPGENADESLAPVLRSPTFVSFRLYEVVKRGLDMIIAASFLVVALPVWCAAALLVRLTSPGPVLFRQVRSGRNGRPFVCFKFRTMIADAEQRRDQLLRINEMSGPVFKVKRDPRITWVGAVLRKTSVDELPQLLNVLRGDMSLVGPRPALPSEVERYSPRQRQRLLVKPGLTCLWQISGRNLIDFDRWIELDIEYVRRRGLLFDLSILVQTIPAVISGRGAV